MYCTIFVTFLGIIFDLVSGQTTSGVSNGLYYLCLPTGTPCPTVAGGGVIDPRIVTPTATAAPTLCPAGTLACYGATNTVCGTRSVTPIAGAIASPGSYPWQAYLKVGNTFAGSGALINPYYVITAAHKVAAYQAAPTSLTVYMGVFDSNILTGNIQSSTVSTVKLNENYNSALLTNDIAILRLTQPIVLGIYNNINTICLPAAGRSYVGNSCTVSGWGQTSFTNLVLPTQQKQVTVTIVNDATCRASFNTLNLNANMYLDATGEICAGGQNQNDACTQDGGSPLVCPEGTGYSLAGLVIWGKNCGQPGVYGVYVNVANYLQWIMTNQAQLG